MRRGAAALGLLALLAAGPSRGQDLAGGGREGEAGEARKATGTAEAGQAGDAGEAWFKLRSALHSSALVLRAWEDPLLFPEQVSGASWWRLRLEPEARPTPWLTASLAYEQRLLVSSSGAGLSLLGSSVLPPEGVEAYRVTPLDWRLGGDGARLEWRHGFDRAFVKAHLPFADVTAGRQAIGWGRGVFFNAVDLFPPFRPLEFDREWRRGVDAVRADIRIGEHSSVDTVAAFGEHVEDSIFASRLRGYAGKLDAELVGGYRARDWVLGGSASAAVAGVELHGELAAFLLPEPWPEGGLFGNPRLIPKAVLGGSYQFNVGGGIRLLAEYHYSGFGVREPSEALARLADPDFLTRFLRGDTQLLGRNAVALLASWQATPTLGVSALLLQDPIHGSGLVAPTLTWDFSEKVTLLAGAYASYGPRPTGLSLGSQFGYVPLTGLVQVRIYD